MSYHAGSIGDPSGESEAEWQERMDTFDAAHLQDQAQTIDAAKALTAAQFHSIEYVNRNRSNEEFVEDLYATFLLRAPDAGGYSNWLSALQNGYGRDHVIQGFAESTEFRNLIIGLGDTPPAGPVCSPDDEQECYGQGGIWDLTIASATSSQIRIPACSSDGCAISIQ